MRAIVEHKHNDRLRESYSKMNFSDNIGWGNGYVLLPKDHKYYNVSYSDIPVNVHGGLTYGSIVTKETLKFFDELTEDDIGMYMIGFDTCHYGDSLTKWPEDRVRGMAENLLNQVIKLK